MEDLARARRWLLAATLVCASCIGSLPPIDGPVDGLAVDKSPDASTTTVPDGTLPDAGPSEPPPDPCAPDGGVGDPSACFRLEACADPVLSRFVLDREEIEASTPLGIVDPQAGTVPTGWMRVWALPGRDNGVDGLIRKLPIYAPADALVTVDEPGTPDVADRVTGIALHTLTIRPCREVTIILHDVEYVHMGSYDPQRAAFVAAGAEIGETGDDGFIDVELQDARVENAFANPDRSYARNQRHDACPIQPAYYPAAVRTLLPDISDPDGGTPWNGECGSASSDVPGTAAGAWVRSDATDEGPRIALVHHPYDAHRVGFSIARRLPPSLSSPSLPNLAGGLYWFTPSTDGAHPGVNRSFDELRPGAAGASGPTSCFEQVLAEATLDEPHPAPMSVLAQMLDEGTLLVEARPGVAACGDAASWTFSARAARFSR